VSEFIADTVKSLGIKKLGFEEDHMSYGFYTDISSKLREVELTSLDGIIERLRQVKDEEEIKLIEKAASIADNAFSEIIKFIKIGMTEKEIDLELEFLMRRNGASGLSFPSIVASGKRSSLPHGAASHKKVEYGDFLTLDFGCVYNGYCSDITRTVIIGKASEKQKEIYDIVLEANLEALKNIRPGITGEELDTIARKVIEKYGYAKYFGHGLGHGVGMLVHELPYVSKKGTSPLQSGMVITDEPGIYISGFGGVRIEDLVLISDSGYRVLSHSSKELIEI
jgi:Xaa-Pro aminopeptidase